MSTTDFNTSDCIINTSSNSNHLQEQIHWKEFQVKQDASAINSGNSLLLLCNASENPGKLEELKKYVSAAISSFLSSTTSTGHSSAFTRVLQHEGSTALNFFVFSTPQNVEVAERCLALHYRPPCLVYAVRDPASLIRRSEEEEVRVSPRIGPADPEGSEEEEQTFVLDFHWPFPFPLQYRGTKWERQQERSNIVWVNDHPKAIEAFFQRLSFGIERTAVLGKKAPSFFLFPPSTTSHGVVMMEGRCAVSGTLARFLPVPCPPRSACPSRNPPPSCSIGSLGLLWSTRCHCCPMAQMALDHIVALLRGVADGLWCTAVDKLGKCEEYGKCVSVPHCSSAAELFRFFVLNIHEDEYPELQIWPEPPGGQRTIPAVIAYPPSSSTSLDEGSHSNSSSREAMGYTPFDYYAQFDHLNPVLFHEERSVENFIDFITTHCLPREGPVAIPLDRFPKSTSQAAGELDWRRRLGSLALEVVAHHDVSFCSLCALMDDQASEFISAMETAKRIDKARKAVQSVEEEEKDRSELIDAIRGVRREMLDLRALAREYVVEKRKEDISCTTNEKGADAIGSTDRCLGLKCCRAEK